MKKILISVVAVLTMVAGVFWFVNNRSTTQKDSASTNYSLIVYQMFSHTHLYYSIIFVRSQDKRLEKCM